jgi:hypothetical protein
MKIRENKFFKPTEIRLKLFPVKTKVSADINSPEVIKGINLAETRSIVERNKTGAYDEVRPNPEMNNWSPLNFMQWFASDSKTSSLPGTNNMDIIKLGDEEKHLSKNNDPANVIEGVNFERGYIPEKK